MKCFSSIHYVLNKEDDNKIQSLLRRMLYLRIKCENQFIELVSLSTYYSIHMTQLESFDYYISIESNSIHYSFVNDMKQNSLNMNIKTNKVSNIVCSSSMLIIYHVLTIPFKFEKLMCIGNIFPNIIFNNVIDLRIYDVKPFEHEFFLRIAYSFPVLKSLCISDYTPLFYIPTKSSVNMIQSNLVAQYPYLSLLSIMSIDTRYVEQFLNENKTNLSCLVQLRVSYEDLRMVTNDFTREETQRNCINIKQLITHTNIVGSKEYHIYFPLLNT